MSWHNVWVVASCALCLSGPARAADNPQPMLVYSGNYSIFDHRGVLIGAACVEHDAALPHSRDRYAFFPVGTGTEMTLQAMKFDKDGQPVAVGETVTVAAAVKKGLAELVGPPVALAPHFLEIRFDKSMWVPGQWYRLEVKKPLLVATTRKLVEAAAAKYLTAGLLFEFVDADLAEFRRTYGERLALKYQAAIQDVIWDYEAGTLDLAQARLETKNRRDRMRRELLQQHEELVKKKKEPLARPMTAVARMPEARTWVLDFGGGKVLDLNKTQKAVREAEDGDRKNLNELFEKAGLQRDGEAVLVEVPNVEKDADLDRLLDLLTVAQRGERGATFYLGVTEGGGRQLARLFDWQTLTVLNRGDAEARLAGVAELMREVVGGVLRYFNGRAIRVGAGPPEPRSIGFFVTHNPQGDQRLTADHFRKQCEDEAFLKRVKGSDVVLYTCGDAGNRGELVRIARVLRENGAASVCIAAGTLDPMLMPLVLATLEADPFDRARGVTSREVLTRALYTVRLRLRNVLNCTDDEVAQTLLRREFPNLSTDKGPLDPVRLFQKDGKFDLGVLKERYQKAEEERSLWHQLVRRPEARPGINAGNHALAA